MPSGFEIRKENFQEELTRASFKEAMIQKYIDMKSSWAIFVIAYINYAKTNELSDEAIAKDNLFNLNKDWKNFNLRLIDLWLVVRPHIVLSVSNDRLISDIIYNLYANLSQKKILFIVDDFIRQLDKEMKVLISLSDTALIRITKRQNE